MAAAYRLVVSSVSCYNSVVVDRRTHSQAVHYCSGPCGALSQGLDCTVAHHGTCSELLIAPDPLYNNFNSSTLHSHNIITQQLPNHGKLCATIDTIHNGCLERAGSSGNLSSGEDSPTWRGKKNPSYGGSAGNLSSSGSLKDITEEAINLASGKLKEFSFDKLRLSSSSHVTLRKGRKVRPDSFSRRSTDLDIIYGHFSSSLTTNTTTSMTNGMVTSNDENVTPVVIGKGTGMEEAKLKGSSSTVSANTKIGGGSTSSHSSFGSLNQSLSTVASLYRSTLGEENLFARLLEKTRLEAATGAAGGEDIRACLDILLKCSEDLKKCTDIIKQCIKRKAGGGPEDGGASPDSVYRAVMTRLSTYLKRLPLELEGIGNLEGSGHSAPGSGHGDLAELVNALHSIQQGPFSPIFGNEQPPRYEDVVQSPPIHKTIPHTLPCISSPVSSSKSDSIHTKAVKGPSLTNGLQHPHASVTQHSLSPPSSTCSSSPTHTSSSLRNSPTSLCTHTPPASPMEALYIEEEETEMGKTPDHISLQTHTPTKGVNSMQNKNETKLGQQLHLSQSNTLQNTLNNLPASSGYIPAWTPATSLPVSTAKASSHRNDDIDKLLMDLENLSQSMSHPRNMDYQTMNGLGSSMPQTLTSPQGENSETGDEEDGALLLRILESIESFAQELVDSGAGSTGSAERKCGKEKEVMRLLQDTLVTADVAIAVGEPSAVGEPGSTLLIQQTPEVIRVQSKPEKKPGTPPPAPATAAPAPTPRSPSPPPTPVIVTPPPPAINIPRFYYPRGLPALGSTANHDAIIAAIERAFTEFEEEKADIYEMGKITKVCGCPLYWKAPMFYGASGERTGFVSVHSFVATWRKLLHSCHDDSSKFIYMLAKPGCNYLEQEDFIPLLQDIVDTHPGLTFLKDAPEFHSRYITTVIQRIFYVVNRSWTGRINITELRRSNFLQTLALLEEEDDINQITDYFSYEHFYVIYCKFWELDTDHDLYIDFKDLARYNDHASSNRITERLFSGAVTRGNAVQKEGRMSYAEFVWFIISEEDKKNPTSIEYWFRCMDVDGDGVLSMYELEYFYEEQCERMERMGIEPLPFQDLLCQMLDLVKPESTGKITLSDLKRCRMAHIFFDTFFNLEKYLDHEQRDPFAVQKVECPEPSDWDKYASEEYEILVAEETANEQLHEGYTQTQLVIFIRKIAKILSICMCIVFSGHLMMTTKQRSFKSLERLGIKWKNWS
uniref:Protein phosphatase 2 regulatory subunit B''alpha n=1 Tax=Nothobranchius furzeri TaxID=105023 RepID=A0A8C6PPQ7_NOTFU